MMPNKTIYVTEDDLPIFEKAQVLAGDNLSSTIAQALRLYVEAHEGKNQGFEEITVRLGSVAHNYKRFVGRLVAKTQVGDSDSPSMEIIQIYQTLRNKIVLYIKRQRNPYYAPRGHNENWAEYHSQGTDARLEIFDSVEELKPYLPNELYSAVEEALTNDPVEFLDI